MLIVPERTPDRPRRPVRTKGAPRPPTWLERDPEWSPVVWRLSLELLSEG